MSLQRDSCISSSDISEKYGLNVLYQQTLALWFSLSLLVLDAQVSLKAFFVATTHLISGESFYTVDDINKLFCINLRFLKALD